MITDELREFMRGADGYELWCPRHKAELAAIADRIDAEHRAALEKLAAAADEDRDGWMELPRDADGQPVRIGDVMKWPTTGETFEVVGIGDGVLFYIDDGSEQADWTGASTKRHHRPDTWERIIEDALDGYHDTDFEKLVARCKALCERTKEVGE